MDSSGVYRFYIIMFHYFTIDFFRYMRQNSAYLRKISFRGVEEKNISFVYSASLFLIISYFMKEHLRLLRFYRHLGRSSSHTKSANIYATALPMRWIHSPRTWPAKHINILNVNHVKINHTKLLHPNESWSLKYVTWLLIQVIWQNWSFIIISFIIKISARQPNNKMKYYNLYI